MIKNIYLRTYFIVLFILFGLHTCWATAVLDFDGDGKTDPVVTRVQNGQYFWYIQESTNGFTAFPWGQAILASGTEDKLVPMDYDGDGKCDIAVWRRHFTEEGQSYFFIYYSQSNTVGVIPWGGWQDQPMPQDYDGDGKADIAVYRSLEYTWYILQSRDGFRAERWANGVAGTPIYGDFDGDGKADLAVYSRDTSPLALITFFIKRSSDGDWTAEQFGYQRADFVVSGDFDGDGKTDIAVWRGMTEYGNGMWYWHRSSDGKYDQMRWGYTLATDEATPGDYDGDGKTDLAVFRPALSFPDRAPLSYFYINETSNGFTAIPWGAQNDNPIVQLR